MGGCVAEDKQQKQSFVTKEDQRYGFNPKRFAFWRNLIVYFCAFSWIGHWMEIPYCLFNDFFFGIVDDNSVVFTHPLEPFMVYGIGVIVCIMVMVPLKNALVKHNKRFWLAAVEFYVIAVFLSMMMELVMGLLMNQPDPVTGVYPLWDNSQLPGNILQQAWIVNDVLLGAILMLYTWVVYPACQKLYGKMPWRTAEIVSAIIIIAFIIVCIIEFGILQV